MADRPKNRDRDRFRDCYGVFLIVRCGVCGATRATPLYRGERVLEEVCEHNPRVQMAPQEIVLQRMSSMKKFGRFPNINLVERKRWDNTG